MASRSACTTGGGITLEFVPTEAPSFKVTLHHGTQLEWVGRLEMSAEELNTSRLLDRTAWIGPTHLKIFVIEFDTNRREQVEFWPSARPRLVDQDSIRIDGRIHMDLVALNQSGFLDDLTQPIPVRSVLPRYF